jgi:hypothetical protein
MNVLDRFSKNTQILNFMKIRPVGAKSFHADQRTDETDICEVAFYNFTKVSKKRKDCDESKQKKSNKMQQCIKIYYSIFILSSTCFGRHTAHHQEPEIASGFAYCNTKTIVLVLLCYKLWVIK